jgi:hypothetical protein
MGKPLPQAQGVVGHGLPVLGNAEGLALGHYGTDSGLGACSHYAFFTQIFLIHVVFADLLKITGFSGLRTQDLTSGHPP